MLPENYHAMSENDQAAHWVGYIYRGMRWAGEDGCDEISMLDRKELAKWKELDPTVARLMPRILDGLAGMWQQPKDAFFQRVNAQMGTQFSRPSAGLFALRKEETRIAPSAGMASNMEAKKRWWKFWS